MSPVTAADILPPVSGDPRSPVIIGVGQYLARSRESGEWREPADLMENAARTAVADAGLDRMPDFGSIRVVGLLSWRYGNPARFVAQRLGVDGAELAVSAMGGNAPQSLVNRTARDIASGALDVALLVGGESWRTRMRARRDGIDLEWPRGADDDLPVSLEPDVPIHHEAEIARGITLPIHVYPMFESALRAARGVDPATHLADISALWSRFSRVAVDNPHAWRREFLTPEQIATPSTDNRMIGTPYTKSMNSNNDVDMAAAVIMCSADWARAHGVRTDRWVFPHSGTDCHEHPHVSHRHRFTETPAIEMGGRLALELAATSIDEIDLIDLYSCFPSAVQLGARSLGLDPFDPARQLTRTGGLCFAGGPWNDYVMHAIATMVDDLRARPGELGFIWANGGYATKHAFGVYGTEPPAGGFRHASPQDAIDRLPSRSLATPAEAAGPATIEAFTVMHDRDQTPEFAIASCLLEDGRRAWGTNSASSSAAGSSDGAAVAAALSSGEWVGRRVTLDDLGLIHLD